MHFACCSGGFSITLSKMSVCSIRLCFGMSKEHVWFHNAHTHTHSLEIICKIRLQYNNYYVLIADHFSVFTPTIQEKKKKTQRKEYVRIYNLPCPESTSQKKCASIWSFNAYFCWLLIQCIHSHILLHFQLTCAWACARIHVSLFNVYFK